MEKKFIRFSGIYVLCLGVIVLITMLFGLRGAGDLTKNPTLLGAVIVYLVFLVLWPLVTV
jgi:hypothetical protein